MGKTVGLTASDDLELDAYVSQPGSEAIAGLVLIQEAFGVNRHIPGSNHRNPGFVDSCLCSASKKQRYGQRVSD